MLSEGDKVIITRDVNWNDLNCAGIGDGYEIAVQSGTLGVVIGLLGEERYDYKFGLTVCVDFGEEAWEWNVNPEWLELVKEESNAK